MSGRRDEVLTDQDITAAAAGSRLPYGYSAIVKQPNGQWLRTDGNGHQIGSAMSARTVASYGYKRHQLKAPQGARR